MSLKESLREAGATFSQLWKVGRKMGSFLYRRDPDNEKDPYSNRKLLFTKLAVVLARVAVVFFWSKAIAAFTARLAKIDAGDTPSDTLLWIFAVLGLWMIDELAEILANQRVNNKINFALDHFGFISLFNRRRDWGMASFEDPKARELMARASRGMWGLRGFFSGLLVGRYEI